MSRVDRLPLGERFGGGADPSRPKPAQARPAGSALGQPGAQPAANRNRRPGGPQRQDWLETKLKGLYDEVAAEPLPPSLQELIDQLDG